MKPPFPYMGGKARIAKRIVALMPEHDVYVEPYAGSLAVLLCKPRVRHEIVNDLDGELVHFWRTLRDAPDELERACALTPYSRVEFELAKVRTDCGDVERARRWWVAVTQGRGRSGAPCGWSHGASRNQSRPASTLSAAERIAAVAERVRNVTLEQRDALDVLRSYDRPGTVAYVDPPYLSSVRSSGGYAVDMPDEESHRALAEVLSSFRGRALVSGYPSRLYDELYGDWFRWESTVHRSSGAKAGASQRAVEVVWCNYDPTGGGGR